MAKISIEMGCGGWFAGSPRGSSITSSQVLVERIRRAELDSDADTKGDSIANYCSEREIVNGRGGGLAGIVCVRALLRQWSV